MPLPYVLASSSWPGVLAITGVPRSPACVMPLPYHSACSTAGTVARDVDGVEPVSTAKVISAHVTAAAIAATATAPPNTCCA